MIGNGTNFFEALDVDVITAVFGEDREGVRSSGSTVMKRELLYSAHVHAKLYRVEFENTLRVETRLDGFQNELTDVKQALNILVQAHLEKTQNISKSVNKGGSNSSSSVANTPKQENLALCKLLDFDGNEVAHERVVTNSSSRMCHFRVVQAHEAKVLLDEVMIGEARLYKAPQNRKMTIQEIEIGS